jgi:hypothetical protein
MPAMATSRIKTTIRFMGSFLRKVVEKRFLGVFNDRCRKFVSEEIGAFERFFMPPSLGGQLPDVPQCVASHGRQGISGPEGAFGGRL